MFSPTMEFFFSEYRNFSWKLLYFSEIWDIFEEGTNELFQKLSHLSRSSWNFRNPGNSLGTLKTTLDLVFHKTEDLKKELFPEHWNVYNSGTFSESQERYKEVENVFMTPRNQQPTSFSRTQEATNLLGTHQARKVL